MSEEEKIPEAPKQPASPTPAEQPDQLTEKGLLVKNTIPTSHKTHGGSTTICTYSTSMTKEIYQLSLICNSFKKNVKKIKRLKRRK